MLVARTPSEVTSEGLKLDTATIKRNCSFYEGGSGEVRSEVNSVSEKMNYKGDASACLHEQQWCMCRWLNPIQSLVKSVRHYTSLENHFSIY